MCMCACVVGNTIFLSLFAAVCARLFLSATKPSLKEIYLFRRMYSVKTSEQAVRQTTFIHAFTQTISFVRLIFFFFSFSNQQKQFSLSFLIGNKDFGIFCGRWILWKFLDLLIAIDEESVDFWWKKLGYTCPLCTRSICSAWMKFLRFVRTKQNETKSER